MTVAKHLSQKTDVQEQIERLRLDYEKLKVSTIEEIESFTKKFDNLKVASLVPTSLVPTSTEPTSVVPTSLVPTSPVLT